MRRRAFRPALESLDFRISPASVDGGALAVPVPITTNVPVDDGPDGTDNPLWNTPSDPGPSGGDNGGAWCPLIGG